mmetsp:Transcript_59404/g.114654  ORF Transcript_59404/g.114654 Transcript_59404/m.114654 type:complete len:85 (+) Transcript_59404:393-647(+)
MPPLYNLCRIRCGNVSVVYSIQICADALLQQCLPTMTLQQHQGLMQWREVTAAPTTARVGKSSSVSDSSWKLDQCIFGPLCAGE